MQIFVVDVAGGDKVPRKGGPGVTAADLLVDQQDRPGAAGRRRPRRDAPRRRPPCGAGKPTLLISLREDPTAAAVADVGARAGPGPRARVRTARRDRRPARSAAGGRCCRWSGRAASSRSAGPGRPPCTWSPRRSARSAGTTRRSGWSSRRAPAWPSGRWPRRSSCPPAGAPPPSTQRITADVAGALRPRAGAHGGRARDAHLAELHADLGPAGGLTATEQVLLGRIGEEPGRWTGTTRVVAGRPAAAAHHRRARARVRPPGCRRSRRGPMHPRCRSVRTPAEVLTGEDAVRLPLPGGWVATAWGGELHRGGAGLRRGSPARSRTAGAAA